MAVVQARKEPTDELWDAVAYVPRVALGMALDLPGHTANTLQKAAQQAQMVAQGPAEPQQKMEETMDIAEQVLNDFSKRGEQLERTLVENLAPWNETKDGRNNAYHAKEEEEYEGDGSQGPSEDETVLRQAEAEVRMLLDNVRKVRLDAEEVAGAKREGKPYAMIQLRMQENLKNAKRAAEQVGSGIAQYTDAGPSMKQATDELQVLLEEAQEWS